MAGYCEHGNEPSGSAQYRHCPCNVTMSRVRVSIVVVGKR